MTLLGTVMLMMVLMQGVDRLTVAEAEFINHL